MVDFVLINPKRKTSSIAMQVSFKGKQYKRPIGESVIVAQWSVKNKKVKVTAENTSANDTNDIIDKYKIAALRTVQYFKEFINPPTKDEFFNKFDQEFYLDFTSKKEDITFCDYLIKYIDRHKNSKSVSCVKKYTTTFNKLTAYQHECNKLLYFKDINIDFYNDFKVWFFNKNYSTNYFGNTIKVIKQVYTEAKIVDEVHSYTAIEHRDFVGTREESDNIYLSDNELKLIFNLDISFEYLDEYYKNCGLDYDAEQIRKKVISYNIIRDRFLIGAYTGLRVSDFGTLENANIGDKFIHLRSKKTDSETVIPMNSIVKAIIARTNLSETISDQKINKHIKEICKMVNINEEILIYKSEGGKKIKKTYEKWELVCTHTARRSFATNAYKAGVPTIAIMKITGHNKESTFLKYIKVSAVENAEILLNHPFFNQ